MFTARFKTASDLQQHINAVAPGLIVAFSDDGLSVAFGDENHSPTEAEFEPLSEITTEYVDGLVAEFLQAVQTN